MEGNRFEYLRIDGKKDLPNPWHAYPVLCDYETVAIYQQGREYLHALIGIQDGYWVAGVKMNYGSGGGGFNPGRKWGQFATHDNALLWVLGYMLAEDKLQGPARQAVLDKINDIRQLKLF